MNRSDPHQTEEHPTASKTGIRGFLENLTGPSKGQIHWLSGTRHVAYVGDDRLLRLELTEAAPEDPDHVATLTWRDNSYSVEAVAGRHVWVNGHRIGSIDLMHGDMIEFGERGPMSRFRLCAHAFPTRWPVDEILGDALAYTKNSRRPLPGRLTVALGEGLRRLMVQTTLFFRVSVIVVLLALVAFGWTLYQNDRRIVQTLEQDARRIEAVTLLLAQTRNEALSPQDLVQLQQQLEQQLNSNTERLGALERRSDAGARVITASAPSVAFVQAAFGLRHIESGELLKEVLGPDGRQLQTPFGQPRIEPFGNGPAAEFQFTGTGFLLADGQYLVTNRHVAIPWSSGNRLQAFEASGLAPEMLKMVVYLPDRQGPIDAVLVSSSDVADLALLSIAPVQISDRGLLLADRPPRAGEEIYLLGYPTGLKALLAQAGQDFLASFGQDEEIGFWSVAERLSRRNLIQPLASRGIVAQTNSGAVIYDAETTVGGSGGPALNRNGQVVAVNAAILPEFGGSNIGVPVSHLHDLLRSAGSD